MKPTITRINKAPQILEIFCDISSIVLGQYKSYVVYNKDIEGMDYIEQPVLWNAKIKEK